MTTTVDAIYEGGKLLLAAPLALPEHARVRVTIQGETVPPTDNDRAAWLRLSQDSLMKTWDNPDDDIFNELLSK